VGAWTLMLKPKSDLPTNIQDLVKNLSGTQAMPLGEMNKLPLLMIKLSEENLEFMSENDVVCTLNPSIFNIEHQGETVAVCFLQIKLNNSDKHIFTVRYDLKNEKQLQDALSFFNMNHYGILMTSDTRFDILEFGFDMKIDFNPHEGLAYALSKATEYNQGTLEEVTYGLTMQADSISGLWEHFEMIAPLEKQWYASMKMS